MADIVRDGLAVDAPTRRIVVVLVRHGESVWNAEGRFQGQQSSGLSPLGIAQARHLDRFLRATFAPFHRVVSSDLQRVVETARPFLDSTGLAPAYDERWREIDVGTWSGHLISDIAREYPDAVADARRGLDVAAARHGETFGEMRKRVWAAMCGIAAGGFDDVPVEEEVRVVVFTHGGPIRVAVAEAMDLSAEGVFWLDGPVNASMTVLRHVVDGHGTIRGTALVRYGSSAGPLDEPGSADGAVTSEHGGQGHMR